MEKKSTVIRKRKTANAKSGLELLMTSGNLAGKRFTVPPEGLRLGRREECEIRVDDRLVSLVHCLFEELYGELRVTDLASKNGTYLNGLRLSAQSAKLSKDDILAVGDTILTVAAHESQTP